MKETGIYTKIFITIITIFIAIFFIVSMLMIFTGCEGGHDAIGYNGPRVVRPGFIH